MRRWYLGPLVAMLAVVVLAAVGPRSAHADQRDFTLINGSASVVITHLFVSHTSLDNWGDDILGADALAPGESIDVHFSEDDEAGLCIYDIKVLGKDGEEGYLYGVDLCSTFTVTFS